jgi:SPX domain protein involved in polyphosphate accumulation
LYLDSPNLTLCKETLTGKKNRFKLRIRGYNDDPAYPKFFEIKRRLNTVIVKDRQRVKHSDVERLLSGGPLPEHYYSTEQEPLKQFLFYARIINAGPLVLVRYIRRAYEDDSENRVRVTFDRKLGFKMCDQPRVTLNSPGWQRHPINDVILEIKFTSRFPAWLTHLVRCLELQQQSFSKYANCVCGASAMKFSAPKVYGFNGT